MFSGGIMAILREMKKGNNSVKNVFHIKKKLCLGNNEDSMPKF